MKAEAAIITEEIIQKAMALRRDLHAHPELSGQEEQTARRIRSFLEASGPDRILEGLGGHGLAAVYDSGQPGPTVLLRADLDALPIQEQNTIAHKSRFPGLSHACGHDGHMAILGALSRVLKQRRPTMGRAVLLFQPEEENGQGAAKLIQDPGYEQIKADFAFALHNLPGFPAHHIVLREGPFAAASKGVIIELSGKSSHAAHPEQGNSPVHMMTELIGQLMAIPRQEGLFRDFALITIIHARLGEIAFGTTPGKAVVMATLRTYRNDDMEVLVQGLVDTTGDLSGQFGIEAKISYTEEFPATINDPDACRVVEEASRLAGARSMWIPEAFRWSEDFGHFTLSGPGALFGIGSGEKHPSLHNPDYDFPDELIATASTTFYHILNQYLELAKLSI